METCVLVIGGGIVGTVISRELSKYKVDVALVEKESDIAVGGPTKANTAIIHAGYDDKPGTLAAKMCARGNYLWSKLVQELSIPLKNTGSLLVAIRDEEINVLNNLLERGVKNNVPDLKIIEGRELFIKEPNLNEKAVAGLYAPTAAIICPYEAAIALAENAKSNGTRILLETKVIGIKKKSRSGTAVKTNRGIITAEYVINAAGLFADEISAKVGRGDFQITPRKGEYLVYDKDLNGLVRHPLFPVPTPISKGIMVSPTIDGNVLAGPNAVDVKDKNDLSTTASGLGEVMEGACKLIPKLAGLKSYVISSFAGLRPQPSTEDFIIKSYVEPRGFINVAGIKSPGLTSAPAIAEKVVDILSEEGLDLIKKSNFKPYRQPIAHPLRGFEASKIQDAVIQNANYGHVVCRCEHVTEGEVVEAIHRGANTLDGVKYRTRAGMGRCQGGFCTPYIIKIIAREKRIPVEKVTKKGGKSRIVMGSLKNLLIGEKDD